MRVPRLKKVHTLKHKAVWFIWPPPDRPLYQWVVKEDNWQTIIWKFINRQTSDVWIIEIKTSLIKVDSNDFDYEDIDNL